MEMISLYLFFAISLLAIQFKKLEATEKISLSKKSISYFLIAIVQIGTMKYKFYEFIALVIIGFSFYELYKLKVNKMIYLVFGFLSALFIYFSKTNEEIIPIFTLVILFDGYSQLFGKVFGRNKIAPKVSPNKTWEGFLLALVMIIFHAVIFDLKNPFIGISNGLLIGLLAFGGDLLASFIKRKHEVKDYSNLIPNHGGFLDRFDSLIFTFSILAIFGFASELKYFEIFKNYTLCFILIFILAEYIYHCLKLQVEISRKFVHIVSGIVTLSFPYFIDNLFVVIVLCFSFMILLIGTKKLKLLQSIHNIERKSYGSIYYPISVIICFSCYLFFENMIYYLVPMLILSISDSLAALVGKIFPQYKLFHSEKTIFGTLAFFVSSLIILWFGLNESLLSITLIASFVTITEFYSKKGIDNLLIVLGTLVSIIFIC